MADLSYPLGAGDRTAVHSASGKPIADITLEPHRYVSKPDELAFTGTETL